MPEPRCAKTEAEDGEELAECAGSGPEDDAEAHMEDADAGIDGWLRGGFPLAASIGEKALAGERGFVEELLAAIAVDAGGGGDEERLRRMAEGGEGSGECAG